MIRIGRYVCGSRLESRDTLSIIPKQEYRRTCFVYDRVIFNSFGAYEKKLYMLPSSYVQ
jgi:hypothetical protein